MSRIMNSVFGRLSLVVLVIVSIHLMARFVLNGVVYFGDLWSYHPPLLSWEPRDIGAAVAAHLFGAIGVALVAIALGVLWMVTTWIFRGKSDYVDPCQDAKCPCARHEVERQDAQDARTAALAVTTAAVASTIISN